MKDLIYLICIQYKAEPPQRNTEFQEQYDKQEKHRVAD